MVFASGHIDLALQTMKEEVFRNLKFGCLNNERYYFAVVAECLWYSCLTVKNYHADRKVMLRIDDIAYWCRRAGMECSYDNGYLYVSAGVHKYMFSAYSAVKGQIWVYGGPTDDFGNYQEYDVETVPPYVSGKTLVKLIRDFDTSIESFYPIVQQKWPEYCHLWKRQEIMRASIWPILSENLSEYGYNYRCSAGNGAEVLDVWISHTDYYGVVHLSIPFESMLLHSQTYCNVIKIISNDFERFEDYGRMARYESYVPWSPDIYEVK